MAYTQHELMKRWLVGPWPWQHTVRKGFLAFRPRTVEAYNSRWRNRGYDRGSWNLIAYQHGIKQPIILSSSSPIRNGGHRDFHDEFLRIAYRESMLEHIHVLPLNLLNFGRIHLGQIKVIEKVERYNRGRTSHEAVFSSRYIGEGGEPEDGPRKYFISGYDSQEGWRNRTPPLFVCELPSRPKSVAEGYEILKPKSVKRAESLGLDVLRQGDIFLIPMPGMTTESFIPAISDHGCNCLRCREASARFQRGRILGTDHEASRLIIQDGMTYVSQWLQHRDHNSVALHNRWFLAVRNTAPIRPGARALIR